MLIETKALSFKTLPWSHLSRRRVISPSTWTVGGSCCASRTASSSQRPGTWFKRRIAFFGVSVGSCLEKWSPVGNIVFSRTSSLPVFITTKAYSTSIGATTIREWRRFSFKTVKAFEIVILSQCSGLIVNKMSPIDRLEDAIIVISRKDAMFVLGCAMLSARTSEIVTD